MRHILGLVLLTLLLVIGAGCGDDEGDDGEPAASAAATAAASTPTAPEPAGETPGSGNPTLREMLGLPDDNVETPDVALLGGADFPTGTTTRIPFLVLDKESGEQVEPDGGTGEVFLAANPRAPVIGPFPAEYHSLEVPGARFDEGTPTAVWTTEVELPEPGPYFLVARYTVNGEERTANTGLNVLEEEATPAVGAKAPVTETPTLASTNGDLAALTTADPPDTTLLEHSVADSIADGVPFVVVFATPKFCQSRICGPIVDIVLDVQKRMADTPMRFIHAEIYKDNNPQNGVAPWIAEWGLISEPWVFVVDGNGVITAKFEGAATADELEQAARAAL